MSYLSRYIKKSIYMFRFKFELFKYKYLQPFYSNEKFLNFLLHYKKVILISLSVLFLGFMYNPIKFVLRHHFGIGGPPIFKTQMYKVKESESLWTIAKSKGISFDSIITVNKLKNMHQLQVGQQIIIPNQSGILYEVTPDESLWSIATQYHVSVEDLIDVNDLSYSTTNSFDTNLEIFIPGVKLSYDERVNLLGLNFIRPAGGRITSRFGWRRDPFNRKKRDFHPGIDFGCNVGTPIKAAANGKVIYAGRKGGYGLAVVLRHKGGFTTIYGHLSYIRVKRGQYVDAGKIIAKSGNTGRSTGPHLHFEVRHYGVPINPLSVMYLFASK